MFSWPDSVLERWKGLLVQESEPGTLQPLMIGPVLMLGEPQEEAAAVPVCEHSAEALL